LYHRLVEVAQSHYRSLTKEIVFALESYVQQPGPVDEALVHTAQFHTFANLKPELTAKLRALIERVEKQGGVYSSLCQDLSNTERTWFSPPELPK
jgi:hypothetical protein